MEPRDWLERLAQETRPSAEAQGRLREGLRRSPDPAALQALLRTLPEPAPGAAERVKARLSAPPPTPPSGRLARRGLIASGLLLTALLLGLRWGAQPTPFHHDLGPNAPEVPGLELTLDGAGELLGDSEAPRVQWQSGALGLRARRPVLLFTREASMPVDGASLTLRRDPLGTHVSVISGEVQVTCARSGEQTRLGAEASLTCLPVSAEGLLARARLLDSQGEAPERLLVELARAPRVEDPELQAELEAYRIELLARAQRPEALARARAWLDEGFTLRRAAVQRIAAGLALRAEGCVGARPHLTALADEDFDAALLLATRCPPASVVEREALRRRLAQLADSPERQAQLRRLLPPTE
ncbi:MAG: hypothetical protein H6741_03075 [Alphaproteobacteria bacterium]|nr:hypothetical protein [Alphaproteobacteria bacterium]